MTKDEIGKLLDRKDEILGELSEIEKKLESVSICEECGCSADDCKMVLWYNDENKTEYPNTLNTCADCRKTFKNYISED